MHDRFSRRGALHTDPGTDATQISGGLQLGSRSNTVISISHGLDMALGRALLAISK
jgi:hypothetical protein